jgi:hypothetical protein
MERKEIGGNLASVEVASWHKRTLFGRRQVTDYHLIGVAGQRERARDRYYVSTTMYVLYKSYFLDISVPLSLKLSRKC